MSIGLLGIGDYSLLHGLLDPQAAGGGVLVHSPAGDAHHVPDDRPALPHQLVITAFAVKRALAS